MPTIRPAAPSDVPQIVAFIRDLAIFENLLPHMKATEADLLRDGFGPNPKFGALVAESAGRAQGYLLYYFSYSTFAGAPGLFVEDVFVAQEFRGQGVGKALLESAAAVARAQGCAKMHWEVLDWNQPAIAVYRSLGGQFLDEWRNVNLSGEAFARLAQAGARHLAPNPEGGRA
jgi:GNAT superfamily N-acetyltransferase